MKVISRKAKKNKKTIWLHKTERILSIVRAALPLFARKGFDGTKTKSLCKSAGVSVGLLYKYFPKKQDLYDAVLEYCLKLSDPLKPAISNLEPGSDTFVFMLNVFLLEIFSNSKTEETELAHKLILRSLSTDGKFAKKYVRKKLRNIFPLMKVSLEVCVKNAELPSNRSWKNWRDVTWIMRHLSIVFSFFNFSFPRQKLYPDRIESLRLESVRFFLLGVGFSPESTEALVKKASEQSIILI
ncbi:TetR/AcrR family transcriptional regulator [Leptospira johnsonii]|uniref:TetR/AcrR family transcriptional regulator n=1 Tax=Leptospira johnsonii TaxID=1917820 RepID=UPI000D59245F|nr:TetR/AcrR family transcriptional regulator [Leptospira johnsonii]